MAQTRRSSSRRSVETVHSLKKRLLGLAQNLRWTWDPPTQRLFGSIDPSLNDAMNRNPVALLNHVTEHRLQRLAGDAGRAA